MNGNYFWEVKFLYLFMETLIINIPEKKSALVKQLLKELGVTIKKAETRKSSKKLNALTAKTIDDAHKGIGLDKPIETVEGFIKSL
ncbi:hypothetical protein FA046_12700 [Pedobacter cryophilus]|uniref:Uncharacterized protein n=2 Tax=Pedobacter cryophilus TaxID=2571271 RepID=A0A4U1C1I9_9SPHI|nr:hypothetical protein FA046_12700 [Pedobacter cryophilus]